MARTFAPLGRRMVARADTGGKAMLGRRGVLAALLALTVTTGQARADDPPARIEILTRKGPVSFEVEWAITPMQQQLGLMYRDYLAPDHGMIFDFGTPRATSFWMRNTPLSLDMLFIAADGRITGIHARAEPLSEDLIPSPGPVRYVLEIGGGIAQARGIAVGDRLGRPLFADAP